MNPLQAMLNGMQAGWQESRADTQLTLGTLIDRLEQLDQESEIDGLVEPHSYRGYYADLAFERDGKRKVSDVLSTVRGCLGETFTGYKGGDFDMGRRTPVWIANYGDCGVRIIEIVDDGSIITEPETK